MALNPIVFTEKVVKSFLRYQLTAYPFADPGLLAQMRQLLCLEETRDTPLMKGPYLSLSRAFRQGARVEDLVVEGLLHPLVRERVPAEIERVYGHQEDAIRAIRAGKTTLVSTGTGSGKSECFLYPIVSRCLELKAAAAPAGIVAVLVYPMNALAEDQLGRLRGLLAGTGVAFGMYVGKTPEKEAEVTNQRLPAGSSRADFEAELAKARLEGKGRTVSPPEEVCSREEMRTAGRQPRILLTNVKQLELLLTRQTDAELFRDAQLEYLVFDEAHTFTGAGGAETACLIRRLRKFCGRKAKDTVCVATSATIVDKEGPEAAREFASRFFGIPKGDVVTVGESYEPEVWSPTRSVPMAPADPARALAACAEAVDAGNEADEKVRAAFRDLVGWELGPGEWPVALHSALSANELVFQLNDVLWQPLRLQEAAGEAGKRVGRRVTEQEVLALLTLGAAARSGGRPLLRPVVHSFVRGIGGAVVSFPEVGKRAKLWLAAEDEMAATGGEKGLARFPVTTCTTCGQHYFVAWLKDFKYTARRPEGGQSAGDSHYWEPLEESRGGSRAVLVDHLVGDDPDGDDPPADRTTQLHFCRFCGTAHPSAVATCRHCGAAGEMVLLFAVKTKKEQPGYLTTCLSCNANGRRFGSRYREPARPVRATAVADVHVLAQDMVHNCERPRLLVFCDNRQEAAFQSGWMKDHARRFRLRSLFAEEMGRGAVSVGDLVAGLNDRLEVDDALSRALVPEVWRVARKEGSGGRHQQERRKFLRMAVLREITASPRQIVGLEPWGRMKVEYEGLSVQDPFVQEKARALGVPPEDLRNGVATLLDYFRRQRVLYDPEYKTFSKFWGDGDLEVQYGYLPELKSPRGTKLEAEVGDNDTYLLRWISLRGDSNVRQLVRKWRVDPQDLPALLKALFTYVKDKGLLVPVTLTGRRGGALPGSKNLLQVDCDKVRLGPSRGCWRCDTCRKRLPRPTPFLACPSWRCDGSIRFQEEDPDNYDLQLLDQGYSMLRPEEHTAMVPHEDRERIENQFKGTSAAVNCLVCTQTLELGVDIGSLDSILMRNVPPLPSNYWQRAGRAGRRHRMAVNLTYCRPTSHDRAYFANPLKMLAGRLDPPAFNLSNGLMVAKHVHAAALTRLQQLTRSSSLPEPERDALATVLASSFPKQVSAYLFEDGALRTSPFDFTPFTSSVQRYRADLLDYVTGVFADGWPTRDSAVVAAPELARHVDGMAAELDAVVARLRRRLRWALDQITRLGRKRETLGTLDPEDDSIFRRCDNLVKRLKGQRTRQRRDAEGYDDVVTFGALAAEGFLPGYGLETGSVLGTAEIPFWTAGSMEFFLPRPPATALREYVPGNLIYANGHKFVARRFHREADEERAEVPVFEVSQQRQALKQTDVAPGAAAAGIVVLPAISVCDVDLIHQSQISDEEENRFQLSVTTFGIEKGQHEGGMAYRWGPQPVHHRRGVRFRLVNVGATGEIDKRLAYGYPICTVCGQSVSPFSSQRQRQEFEQDHSDRCGKRPSPVGFYADAVADAFSIEGCANQGVAYGVLEALRVAASSVLDMSLEDLQVLVVGHVDRDEVDGLLWDPMPGGSGLIDQMVGRWPEVVAAAKELVESCPGGCATSCPDCLQRFRNAYYHKHLDRNVIKAHLDAWGPSLAEAHEIPPVQPAQVPEGARQPTNEREQKLRQLLLAAGFGDGNYQERVELDRALGYTLPDVVFRTPHQGDEEGVAIYLDGLSAHLHGNPATAARDREIRDWLRNSGWEVIEIHDNHLDDAAKMSRHFRRLARYLGRPEPLVRSTEAAVPAPAEERPVPATHISRFRLVSGRPEERYVTCVPLATLRAAAHDFDWSDPSGLDDVEQWVEVTTSHRLGKGCFVAKVSGKSMEPLIPDGSFCLFRGPVQGSRVGVFLVQYRGPADPDTGGQYAVKTYESEKVVDADGLFRHTRITLKPRNHEYQPIQIDVQDEESVKVVAQFLEVVG